MNLGSVRERLVENGYAPSSALEPGAFGYACAEHPAAVLTVPQLGYKLMDHGQRRLVALVLTARDQKIRAELSDLIAARGLAGGPTRIGSDGSSTYLFRYEEWNAMWSRASEALPGEIDPAAVLLTMRMASQQHLPALSELVRLDGEWPSGSLLDVKRESLPSLRNEELEALCREIGAALSQASPRYVPEPVVPPPRRKPSAVRKRDLVGGPAGVMKAYQEAVDRGEAVWLPDEEAG